MPRLHESQDVGVRANAEVLAFPQLVAILRVMVGAGVILVDGREIGVSSRDRVVFPDIGVTKGQVLDFHARTAELIIRHSGGRPVALRRWPQGLSGQGFFQKNAGAHFPDWLRRVAVPKRDGDTLDHPVLTTPADVVYLANQGTIEFHPWVSAADDLDHPLELLVDLDPPEDADVALVRGAARTVRDVLADIGVEPRIKTSGSKGYHVHVALDGSCDFAVTHRLAEVLQTRIAAADPDHLTDAWRKSDRGDRVLIDMARNSYGQTSVAAYSLRGRPGAPVAAPIDWDELSRIAPADITMANLFRRLGQRDDPWADQPTTHNASEMLARLEQPDQS